MLFPALENTLLRLDTSQISDERKRMLQPLTDYIQEKVTLQKAILLNFICTHNSRRSHLSQVWAQALAYHFNIKNVFCYSGGTEATALFPMAAKTLEDAGYKIHSIAEGTNPIYSIKYTANAHPIIGFSKTYDDPFNPVSEFAAIMTCSQADVGCPFIPGAEKRFSLPFEDPKSFDQTPQQEEKYRERSLQIASGLFYVYSQIKA
ncbi:protein-tyrosine-phosphatase [Arenibacter sp. GZD96]|uniref:arsenate-mycothiol transferase ArsC n=1 Tax=Aurantibrevibacter litoralis TaxID=3106030 RepID=UPI002AFEDDBB|nr:hypothetical protein [Arenibacter sp. GZD-96]MEA1785760.1 protein-tyrosine-phosphatase [Arenibacter sp. GZD-96]